MVLFVQYVGTSILSQWMKSYGVTMHGTTFSRSLQNENWNASEFFLPFPLLKVKGLKNTAISLNRYEVLSLLKIIPVLHLFQLRLLP